MADSMVRGTAEVVKGALESEIVRDTLLPAAKEAGKALQTVGQVVNTFLMPLRVWVNGMNLIEAKVEDALANKLKTVPPSELIQPQKVVSVPALQALTYTMDEPDLREMYLNLLATAMNAATAATAHPSFVEVIRQLTPDEAKILSMFVHKLNYPAVSVWALESPPKQRIANVSPGGSGLEIASNFTLLGSEAKCTCPEQSPVYLENLSRLGLLSLSDGQRFFVDRELYAPLTNHDDIKELFEEIKEHGKYPSIVFGFVQRTLFGQEFLKACAR